MNIELLRKELIRLSGGGRRLSKNRTSGLYATINLPDFMDIKGLRDINIRFLDFGIKDMKGKSVVEFGSNMGALSWEALNMGATKIVGYEFNEERVIWCNHVSKLYNLNATFFSVDFNKISSVEAKGDVVFACSVDEYLDDYDNFYKMVADATLEVCYFESNIQDRTQTVKRIYDRLLASGFSKVLYYGDGESGGNARRRKTFKCFK